MIKIEIIEKEKEWKVKKKYGKITVATIIPKDLAKNIQEVKKIVEGKNEEIRNN